MPRGKKTCPQCNASVGPRLRVCECGHEFAFKQKIETQGPVRDLTSAETPVRLPPKIPPKASVVPVEKLSDDPPKIVAITDRQELTAFIAQLQDSYTKSDRSGGGYSAFLHHKHGTLQVHVCLTMRLPQ